MAYLFVIKQHIIVSMERQREDMLHTYVDRKSVNSLTVKSQLNTIIYVTIYTIHNALFGI